MKRCFILGVLFVLVLSGCEKNENEISGNSDTVDKAISEKKENNITEIGNRYFKDDRNVYFLYLKIHDNEAIERKFKKMNDVDYDTFELVGNDLAKDEKNCYKSGAKVDFSECNKIIDLGNGYFKDDKNIYFRGIMSNMTYYEIENDVNNFLNKDDFFVTSDLENFKIFSNPVYARDKNNCFFRGMKEDMSECEN